MASYSIRIETDIFTKILGPFTATHKQAVDRAIQEWHSWVKYEPPETAPTLTLICDDSPDSGGRVMTLNHYNVVYPTSFRTSTAVQSTSSSSIHS